ncbi:hypothetical protein RQP46_000731 [Phenoliferia psychrophenolica]
MRASHSLQLFYASLLPGLAFGAAGVMTTNSKAAASLQAAAVVPASGTYTFTSVATGEKLTYQTPFPPGDGLQPNGNHIWPSKAGAPVNSIEITPHQHAQWIRLGFGTKNKCLSSAWGGSYDNAAVAYVCASGSDAQKTTLEQTKQWWLAVPIGKTAGAVTASSNEMLIAAQGESVATRNAKIKAAKAAFGKRDENSDTDIDDMEISLFDQEVLADDVDEFTLIEPTSGLEKRRGHGRTHRGKHSTHSGNSKAKQARAAAAARAKAKAKAKAKGVRSVASTKGSIGTFYIIPSDHLIDQATRALTAEVVMSRGIKTTALTPWKKGSKAQMWILTKN